MKNKLIISSVIAVLVSALTLVLYQAGLFERAEEMLYDAKAKMFRAGAVPPKNIKVVLVDDASISALEQTAGRWPWPRAIWSDLLDFLVNYGGAKAVLFDILFTERQDEINDGALAQATANAGNIVHSMIVTHQRHDPEGNSKGQFGKPLPSDITGKFALKNVQGWLPVGDSEKNNDYTIPIDVLRPAANHLAVVEFTPDVDGVLRRTKPVREYQGNYFPVLGLAPFIDDTSKIVIGDKAIQINDRILPVDRQGNCLINMYGVDSIEPISAGGIFASLQSIRAGDIERLVVNPEEFQDSIVFVGVSAVGGADLKATPLATRAPGVIMHVSLASNYLQKDFLMPPDSRFTSGSAIAGVLLVVSFVFFTKQFLVRALFPAIILAGFTVYSFYAFKSNLFVETVPFVFATISSGFLSFGYLTFTEAAEKRRVSQVFSQYVSKDVLNEVLHNYKEYLKTSAGQKVEITILFSDIRGFTTMSENAPPEMIVQMLNIHFTKMADIILKHKGTLDKYIGDAIMAFWGAPLPDVNHAENAVMASIEMLQALNSVNAELKEKGMDMKVKIGVGLNTGVVTIGNIGSEKKLNYTVVGDAVNLSSRLESLTKEYQTGLLLSEYTYEMVKDKIPCVKLGNVKVKGREKAVDIYTPEALVK